MKLFSTQDIKKIEKYTIEEEQITSLDLMERASSAIACEIISRYLPNRKFIIFAGHGNNGGDALAVGRMLVEQGYHIEVFLFNIGGNILSEECEVNRNRLRDMGIEDFTEITGAFNPPYIDPKDVVIDGLFGSGLSRPLTSGYASLVRYINESGAEIVSIDVPSGLYGDWNSENSRNNIVNADLTLAIQFPRLAFFFSENAEFIGEYKVLDIELSSEAIRSRKTDMFVVEKDDIKRIVKPRDPYSNKYDYGSLMLVAGSYGMMGAAVIASRAAMRSGCGLVGVHAPLCGMTVMQSSVPEVLFDADKHEIVTKGLEFKRKYSSIAIGPGIGTNALTVDALEHFLINANSPCVLDADALNCIKERPSLLNNIPIKSIITPHTGEFDRLFGKFYSDEMRLKKALDIAKLYSIIIVLKGHHTIVVRPDGKLYINDNGNSGMATAGSGDALTGIIGSLMAQGYIPEISSVAGVFIHGLAGDIAAKKIGKFGMIASDIVDAIPAAMSEIIS